MRKKKTERIKFWMEYRTEGAAKRRQENMTNRLREAKTAGTKINKQARVVRLKDFIDDDL